MKFYYLKYVLRPGKILYFVSIDVKGVKFTTCANDAYYFTSRDVALSIQESIKKDFDLDLMLDSTILSKNPDVKES